MTIDKPVLLLTFNRPDLTVRVLDAIRRARPPRLYFASDGPRPDHQEEAEAVAATRALLDTIDWPCDVTSWLSEDNLGCRDAVSGAVTRFFEAETAGIILEDDCLPHPTFFPFCEQLLDRYADEPEILHLGGTHPFPPGLESNTYHVTRYNRIWGWASWRRAWQYFDAAIPDWPEWKAEKFLYRHFPTRIARFYEKQLDACHAGDLDTWDYQWLVCRLRNGWAIAPGTNLVRNLGFRLDATHTTEARSPFAEMELGKMTFPLKDPPKLNPDKAHDQRWEKYLGPGLRARIRSWLKR